jgi:hypothetical protein
MLADPPQLDVEGAAEAAEASGMAAGGKPSVRHVPAGAHRRAAFDRERVEQRWPSSSTTPSSTPPSGEK